MNHTTKWKQKRASIRSFALFFFFISFLTSNHAQIGIVTGLVGAGVKKGQEKKLQKSPARDFIPKAEKLAESLISQSTSSSLESSPRLNDFLTDFDTLSFYKAEINRLDPKWKTKKIDESINTCKPNYERLMAEKIKFIENKKQFDRYKTILNSLKEKFYSAEKKGELLSYVKGEAGYDYKWAQIMQIVDSAQIVQDYYSKTYNKFGYSSSQITGLDFFKNGDVYKNGNNIPEYKLEINYKINNINNQSDYKELPAKATGQQKTDQYSLLSKKIIELEALLIMWPDNVELKAAQTKVSTLYNNLGKQFDKIVTGPFHKANINKVFLSNHKIVLGTETDQDFKTTFKGGEPIYVTYYLGEKILATKAGAHYYGSRNEFYPKIEKYGKDSVSVIQYALAPEIGTGTVIELTRVLDVVEDLNRQTEPKEDYTLRVSDKVSINYTVEISATETYQKHFQAHRAAKASTINMPKTGMTDAAVQARVKSQLEDPETGNKDITVLRVVIVSKEWEIETWKYSSLVKYRGLSKVVAVCKDNKGNCFLMPGTFYQKNEGGVFSKGNFDSSTSYDNTIDGTVSTDEDYRLYITCNKF